MLRITGIILIVAIAYTSAQPWCGLESCKGKEHIDCSRGDGTLAPYCDEQESVSMMAMGTAQAAILEKFNTFRNEVAMGQKAGFQPAVRMGLLRWNVTLANLARKNVRNCVSEHDGCRNTPDFDFVGQILGYSKHPATDTRTNYEIVTDIMDYWLGELANATMADMTKYPGNSPTRKIADVSQILRDDACRVGCAALKYTEPDDKDRVMLFACNFDVGTILNYPVYKAGATASKCTTGTSADYSGLCTLSEPIRPNKFWEP